MIYTGLSILLWSISVNTQEEVDIKLVSGISWEQLPNIHLYTGSIPLVYNIKWNKTDEILLYQNISSKLCEVKSTSYECEMFTLYEDLNTQFRLGKTEYGRMPHHVIDELRIRNPRGLQFLGSFFEFCCNVVTKNRLHNLYGNQEKLEQFTHSIHKYMLEEHKILSQTSQQLSNYSEVMGQIINDIYDKLNASYNILHRTVGMETTISYTFTALMTAMLVNFQTIMETRREAEQRADTMLCQQHLIPTGSISFAQFKDDLVRLEEKLNDANIGLSIPSSNMLLYFSTALATCVMAENEMTV